MQGIEMFSNCPRVAANASL